MYVTQMNALGYDQGCQILCCLTKISHLRSSIKTCVDIWSLWMYLNYKSNSTSSFAVHWLNTFTTWHLDITTKMHLILFNKRDHHIGSNSVSHLLWVLMCCPCWDDFLLTTAVKCAYFNYCRTQTSLVILLCSFSSTWCFSLQTLCFFMHHCV